MLPLFPSLSIPQPPACRLHSQSPSSSLSFCSLACPCSPSTFLSPSFFPLPPISSSSSHCALDSLSFPLAHTLRQRPPLSTSTSTLTSSRLPLSTPLASFLSSPTNTYHLWLHSVVSLSLHSLLSISSIAPSLSHTQPCSLSRKLTRTHTHADWHPRTEHPLSQTGDQVVYSCGRAS